MRNSDRCPNNRNSGGSFGGSGNGFLTAASPRINPKEESDDGLDIAVRIVNDVSLYFWKLLGRNFAFIRLKSVNRPVNLL